MSRAPLAAISVGLLAWSTFSAFVAADDWPQWGGKKDRNMACARAGSLPDFFDPGTRDVKTREIDLASAKNVKWIANLDSMTNSSPVVARGRVLIGTNARARNPGEADSLGESGKLVCLDEQSGRLLWQLVIPRLTSEECPEADTGYGICSTATVEGDRVYVVSNRGEVLCLDIHGQANGNDGPFLDEGQYLAGPKKSPIPVQSTDGDILWIYNIIQEVKVRPHDASSCSILIQGDVLYVCTGNAKGRALSPVAYPRSPSLIALDKRTGRLLAKDDEKIGTRLYKGQWSSPSLIMVHGKSLILYGGGDGVCYAFEPVTCSVGDGVSLLKKIWWFDCVPPERKFRDGKPVPYDSTDGPSEIIGTPAVYGNKVYVTIGQDPRFGRGRGNLSCIAADKVGDVTGSAKVWTYDRIERSLSTPSVAEGLVYVADYGGTIHCLDAETGRCYWTHETGQPVWGSTFVADCKVYLGTTRRNLWVLAADKEKKVLGKIRLDSGITCTPCAANGVFYVASQRYLWAVQKR